MTIETTKQALEKWHQMIKTGDLSNLNELLADDVVFRSPVAFKPYEGKHVVFFILTNVIQVFENFTYHREFYTEDGENVVLEFSANVSGKSLKGIDMVRFNGQGKIIDFFRFVSGNFFPAKCFRCQTFRVSLPRPPTSVSAAPVAPPSSVLMPALPVIVWASSLPVRFSDTVAVGANVSRNSILSPAPSVKLTTALTRSAVPWPTASVIWSPALRTM